MSQNAEHQCPVCGLVQPIKNEVCANPDCPWEFLAVLGTHESARALLEQRLAEARAQWQRRVAARQVAEVPTREGTSERAERRAGPADRPVVKDAARERSEPAAHTGQASARSSAAPARRQRTKGRWLGIFAITAAAKNNLGVRYANGRGVAQDDAEAVRWYRKAAEQGHARAQTNLGGMYEFGRGVAQDDAEAVRWYRKAAAQGRAGAKQALQRRGLSTP